MTCEASYFQTWLWVETECSYLFGDAVYPPSEASFSTADMGCSLGYQGFDPHTHRYTVHLCPSEFLLHHDSLCPNVLVWPYGLIISQTAN